MVWLSMPSKKLSSKSMRACRPRRSLSKSTHHQRRIHPWRKSMKNGNWISSLKSLQNLKSLTYLTGCRNHCLCLILKHGDIFVPNPGLARTHDLRVEQWRDPTSVIATCLLPSVNESAKGSSVNQTKTCSRRLTWQKSTSTQTTLKKTKVHTPSRNVDAEGSERRRAARFPVGSQCLKA